MPFGRKRKQRHHAFSRGFLPFSVLPVAGSHLIPAGSRPTGYVSPSGFRTLSALCSPHDLPGLFHPGPAHGLCPSRFSSSNAVPYALSSAAPLLRLTLPSKEEVSTSGVNTLPGVPNAGPGFSQVTASDTSMGFFPFEASCQYRREHPLLAGFYVPSRASYETTLEGRAAGASGLPPVLTQRFSFKNHMAPLGFPTSSIVSSLRRLCSVGLSFPLESRSTSPWSLWTLSLHAVVKPPAVARRENRIGDNSAKIFILRLNFVFLICKVWNYSAPYISLNIYSFARPATCLHQCRSSIAFRFPHLSIWRHSVR
jgi:hypothetical protein